MNKLKKGICFIVLFLSIAGLITVYFRVQGTSSFYGYVEYDDDGDDIPQSGVTVVLADSLFNIMGVDTTDSNGYYSISTTPTGNTPYSLTTMHYRWENEIEYTYSAGSKDIELDDGITEKIGVFFWTWDCTNEDSIANFTDTLEEEDYTTFFIFGNSGDVEADCETVDDYERDVDTVFTYVVGHGDYSGGHSYTYFKSLSRSQVWSDDFRDYMDTWEAPRKCLLVDSCYSEGWADDFAASPHLAMSSTDDSNEADVKIIPDEFYGGEFSFWFFKRVYSGYTAVQSFNYADGICSDQNAQKQDYSSYVWFN